MNPDNKLTATELLLEEQRLGLPNFGIKDALVLGDIAKSLALNKDLPIAIEVRIGDWIVYHCSLPGSKQENDWWISRKARVVKLKEHSTLFERLSAEERSVNWFIENGVSEVDFAIHGGGLPLITKKDGFIGSLLISGLPQIEDHLFGVETLTEYLALDGELL
jgi:uncharacterized protein (UPF0303 family)